MTIQIDESNLKQGLLGLVIALVEIIKDALRTEAYKRMEGGRLTEEEINRLGEALWDLDLAIEQIKIEHGVTEAVKNVRDGLDQLVEDVVERMINPERWEEELREQTSEPAA